MTALATAPSQTVAVQRERTNTLMDIIRKRSDVIAKVIPKHMNAEMLVALFQVAVSRNPKLGECTPMSALNSVIKAGQLGLECSGATGEAYLVPYFNGRTKTRECQLQTGYKGIVKLAKNAGRTTSVEARAVYEKDQFSYEFGLSPRLVHRPWDDDETRGPLVFVYAVARFKEGDPQFDVMSKVAVDKIRARSQSRDNGPWVTDYDEMAKKTVVRRLGKMLDQSPALAKQLADEDSIDRGDFIDAEPTTPTDALNRQLNLKPVQLQPADEQPAHDAEESQVNPEADAAAESQLPPAGTNVLTGEVTGAAPAAGDEAPVPRSIEWLTETVMNKWPASLAPDAVDAAVKKALALESKPWGKLPVQRRLQIQAEAVAGTWPKFETAAAAAAE